MKPCLICSRVLMATLTVALGCGIAACSDSEKDEGGQTDPNGDEGKGGSGESTAEGGSSGADESTGEGGSSGADESTAGGGGDAGSGGDDSAAAADVTVSVSAEDGGTVEDEEGTVVLEIPAGALSEDVDVTLSVGEPRDGAEASVYEFGPDGLEFSEPVTLTIQFDGEIPEGQQAVLAVEEDGEWVAIEGSGLDGSVVSGEITHFSSFTIIFVDGVAVLVSDCTEAYESFSACGGEIEGTWAFESFCYPNQDLGEVTAAEQCPDAYADLNYEISGTVTFSDGNVTMGEMALSGDWSVNWPMSCVEAWGEECDAQALYGEESEFVCTVDGDTCGCSSAIEEQTIAGDDDPGTYTTDGNDLTITNTDGAEVYQYCIQGDELQIWIDDPEGAGQVLEVLTRQ